MALLVEGLGVGGETSIKEYIIGPVGGKTSIEDMDNNMDNNQEDDDKDKIKLYGPEAGLSCGAWGCLHCHRCCRICARVLHLKLWLFLTNWTSHSKTNASRCEGNEGNNSPVSIVYFANIFL
ncbi:hypothetical protein Syun_016674 [Stephania yunnanensis]|uniref:Uncharacterized protein n=1 Tax=Stephania yunnanensis TaxID=152371 RepID=A0AAP0J7W0_9MAGN